MLEGKCGENRVPKNVELTLQKKNRSEQEQNKDNEKGKPKEIENQRKMNEKKER